MNNKPMMKCGHAANAVTADNKSLATQLLREIREDWMDWSDAGQVSQKFVEVFKLLHQAGHEFDEEYLSKALEYLEMAIKKGE